MTDQQAIWNYYQGRADHVFDDNCARCAFILRRLRRGLAVLNVGIGNGWLEKAAAAKGLRVSSLDPSPEAVRMLADAPGIDARTGDIRRIPWPDGCFDAVVASEVIEHLSADETTTALGEIARVLKPGGRFLGTVPFEEDLEKSLVVCPRCESHFHRWGHQQSFTSADLRHLLQGVFSVSEVSVRKFVPWRRRSWLYRISGMAKLALVALGGKVADSNLFFEARLPLQGAAGTET